MPVRVTINLPDELASHLEEQYPSGEITLEDIVVDRLSKCKDHKFNRCLYFGDKERQELEQLVGKNLANALEVIKVVKNALSVKVDGVKVPIRPITLERLHRVCRDKDFPAWISKSFSHWSDQFMGVA